MEWLTMEDIAKYESVPIGTIWRRHSEGYYQNVRTEPPENGGKDRVYIELSCLSKEAQARYKRHKKYIEKDFPRELRKHDEDYTPWFYNADIPAYIAKHKEIFKKALTVAEIVENYLEHLPNEGRMDYVKPFLAMANVKYKQFRTYVNLYKAGAEFGRIKSEETGENYEIYKIIALCTPPRDGMNAKITPEMEIILKRLWSDKLYQTNRQTVVELYDKFKRILEENGAEYVPCCRTVRRYIDKLEYHYGNEKALLQGGERHFKNVAMMKCRRDIGSLQVMEFVQADTHKFDCWVEFIDEYGEVSAIRPSLVGFIDSRSRCLVGYGICEQANSEILKQVIINMVKPKKNTPIYGVPKVLLIDNGKDFTAKTLTGVNRSERYYDDELKGFYGMAGITEFKRALPYQPWTKGQIERIFGTITGSFSKRQKSYTGTLTGSRTENKIPKDIDKLLKDRELPTLEEFAKEFESYINNEYHQKEHTGLKRQGEPIPTPIGVYMSAERYFKAAPPDEYMLSFLGKSEERNVNNVGLYLKGNTYTSEELARYIGQRVIVRYNERDLETICVYSMDNAFLCKAYSAGLLDPAAPADDENLTEHIKRQKRQLRTAKANIDSMQRGFVYGLELPENSDEKRKVVTLPQGKQYEKRVSNISEERKKNRELPEFLRAQAAKAIERIEGVK